MIRLSDGIISEFIIVLLNKRIPSKIAYIEKGFFNDTLFKYENTIKLICMLLPFYINFI